jgi:predicted nucleic acid-binding Zn ribbon protein
MLGQKLKKCPKCGKLKLVRLIGAGTGIIFKGSGFYETDYKKTSPLTSGSGSGTKKSGSKELPSESKTQPTK